MAEAPAVGHDERVLVLAPTGHDGRLACEVLREAGLTAQPCASLGELVELAVAGAGAALIAEEALVWTGMPLLVDLFGSQPAWSDLPTILMTSGGELTSNRIRTLDLFRQTGNMTLLERPFRPMTLVSAVQVALRARRRQYQVRALLEQREEKARELARSNEELEQFAYVASHDLQEPLRMITSYLQLLDKRHGGALDGQARRYMDYAIGGARRMQDLIRAILQFSRAGRHDTAREPTPGSDALDDALRNLEAKIKASGARVASGPLPTVPVARAQLSQLLQNLIGNAIKFRSQRPPLVEITAREDDAAWTFTVRDNGIGIRSEDRERLFKIFQRLHTVDEYPGSGIGLATCKKIVEHHGGRIWVESTWGEGSSFSFSLPKRP